MHILLWILGKIVIEEAEEGVVSTGRSLPSRGVHARNKTETIRVEVIEEKQRRHL